MAFGFPAKYSERIELNISRQAAREAIEYSLGLLGWSFSRLDADNFLVRYQITPFSWGERVAISLSEPGILYVESKCLPFQVFDWGKNKRNVTDFRHLFDVSAIRDAKLLNEISEGFERANESRVDRFLDENKVPEIQKRGNE
jgi:hypothetical protein